MATNGVTWWRQGQMDLHGCSLHISNPLGPTDSSPHPPLPWQLSSYLYILSPSSSAASDPSSQRLSLSQKSLWSTCCVPVPGYVQSRQEPPTSLWSLNSGD